MSLAVAGPATRRWPLVGRENGTVEPLTVPPAPYLSPRLSPDGGKLVVQTAEDDGNVIWLYDLAGDTQIQQLTFEGNNQRPIWTPDGQRITFSSDREGTMSLYSMPADGSGAAERLTTADEGTRHWPQSWAPDGQTLLFNVQRGEQIDWDIWSLSANDRETHSLYATPDTIYRGAELSPNGQWLAYSSASSAPTAFDRDIYVEPFPPTVARRRISQNGGFWPLWSPGGDDYSIDPFSALQGSPCGQSMSSRNRTLRSAMSRRYPSKGSRWWLVTGITTSCLTANGWSWCFRQTRPNPAKPLPPRSTWS